MPSPAHDCVLSLDIGSQSLRACLFEQRQRVSAVFRSPAPPTAEKLIDLNALWQSLDELFQELAQTEASRLKRCQALALTTQRATQVFLDDAFKPVGGAYSWQDRTQASPPPMPTPWRQLIDWAGHSSSVAEMRAKAPSWKHWQADKAAWGKVRYSALLSAWLHHRLTGQFRDCAQAQVGYLPYLHRYARWAPAGHWMWSALPLRRTMLPKLVEAGKAIAPLRPALAQRWRLPQHLPVVACAGDKAMEALGSGCLHSATAAVSLGTQITLHQPLRRYRPAQPPWPLFNSARPGYYLDEIDTGVSAGEARRLAQSAAPGGPPLAPETRADSALLAGVQQAELIAYGDYLRQIAESVVSGAATLARRNRSPISHLRLSGGLSQSEFLLQRLNAAAQPNAWQVERISPHAGLYGVAMTAWRHVTGDSWPRVVANLFESAAQAE